MSPYTMLNPEQDLFNYAILVTTRLQKELVKKKFNPFPQWVTILYSKFEDITEVIDMVMDGTIKEKDVK